MQGVASGWSVDCQYMFSTFLRTYSIVHIQCMVRSPLTRVHGVVSG